MQLSRSKQKDNVLPDGPGGDSILPDPVSIAAQAARAGRLSETANPAKDEFGKSFILGIIRPQRHTY